MRKWMMIAPLMLAACGDGGGEGKQEAAAASNGLEPGLYEVTREVTNVRTHDEAPPVMPVQQGDSETSSVCVGPEEGTRPSPLLFAGADVSCEYRNFYMRGGRLNASLSCTREGASGQIAKSLSGQFTADSFEGDLETMTYLASPGNLTIASRLTGRRTGDCPAEAAPAG